jgi:amidase
LTDYRFDLDPAAGRWPALTELRALLADQKVSAGHLVLGCLRRIAAIDGEIHAVLAADPTAMVQARESDHRLANGSTRPLEGIPVLVMDNVDTAGVATTAGSRLLAGCPPRTDADIVGLLRAAGAIILGKTNLSEWGNFRSTSSSEGWSAVGGQTRNPYVLDRSPWGSSSGSAAAVAAGIAPLAIGTETDGSLVRPAAACGVVGLKPAYGLLSNRGIVPISSFQDTPGLLAGTVADAAYALAALTGTPMAHVHPGLAGRRIGLWPGDRPTENALDRMDRVAETLAGAGADIVAVDIPVDPDRFADGLSAMIAEFAPSLNAYLRTRQQAPADLAAVLAANRADPRELALFGQELMELAAAVTDDDRIVAHAERVRARAWANQVLDDALVGVDCVVAPTGPPAWPIDHELGDPFVRTTSTIPALAGRPNISVPVGLDGDLPVGVSVFGPADTATVLCLAAGVATCWPRSTPRFLSRQLSQISR